MAASLRERILAAVAQAALRYYRLVLVVGPPGSGKTKALREVAAARGPLLLNVNLRLCERLVELPSRQRALRAPQILADLVDELSAELVLLDNLEVLFSPELALDPLRLLQRLSRNRTIVASWPGGFVNGRLTYAEPGHPEARSYQSPGGVVVEADLPQQRSGSPAVS